MLVVNVSANHQTIRYDLYIRVIIHVPYWHFYNTCSDIHIGSRVDSGAVTGEESGTDVTLTLGRIFNHVCGDREPWIFAEKTGQFQLRLWRQKTGTLLDICGCFCGHKHCVLLTRSQDICSRVWDNNIFFDKTLGLLQELGHLQSS